MALADIGKILWCCNVAFSVCQDEIGVAVEQDARKMASPSNEAQPGKGKYVH